MFRNSRLYLSVTAILFIILIAFEHYAPKPLDWTITYNPESKSPYGCYVLNDLYGSLFPDQFLENNYDGFFTSLDSTSTENKNIIVITSDFAPDTYDLDALLKSVEKGNDIFISSTSFGKLFKEKLKIEIFVHAFNTSLYQKGEEVLNLLNPELQADSGYQYSKRMPLAYFTAFDTINTRKLGTYRFGKVNFICTQYGSGKLFIHTLPLVFTNYHLIYGNTDYASKVLSYLPNRQTMLDNYYKPDRIVNSSPMRYLLSQPPLQSAYYLLLLTLLLYMVFESKRRQRVIPVIKAPENRSLQFVKTIGSLYLGQRNNIDLAKKMMIYFREFLREHYFLTNISASGQSAALISQKSGVQLKFVKLILDSMAYYDQASRISDEGLIELNRKMEQFYKQCL